MDKLVSIIVPFYNVEKYISRCIQSIIDQTYQNIELILIDDCSTDSSAQIVYNLIKSNTNKFKIKYIKKEKRSGIASSRNIGLQSIGGDYFLFVDGDDWIETNMIGDMLSVIHEAKSDICICGYFIDYQTKKSIVHNIPHISTLEEYADIIYSDGMMGALWNKMLRTAFVKKLNLRFIDGADMFEDFCFVQKLLALNPKISPVYNSYYHYRRNSTSITAINNKRSMNALININSLVKFLRDNNILSKYIWGIKYHLIQSIERSIICNDVDAIGYSISLYKGIQDISDVKKKQYFTISSKILIALMDNSCESCVVFFFRIKNLVRTALKQVLRAMKYDNP